jgi:hypothetical protein
MNMTIRFIVDTFVLLKNNLNIPGTTQMAFIMRMARATSNLGKTRNTNIDMPKLCAVSTINTKNSILNVGHGLLPNRDLKILSKNVNKYGEHMVIISIHTHLSLYGF